jgi:uncharacterized protein (DUF362 family)
VRDVGFYRRRLAELAHADGGWGYAPGQPIRLEPTCLALLALAQDRPAFGEVVERGLARVRQAATPDGAFRLPGDREEAIWPTALVLFLQVRLEEENPEIHRTAARVLSWQGRTQSDRGMEEVHDIDLKLVGWAWAENNFSWAEPTAWACLALRHAGQGSHPRVQEGIRLLLDRAFDDGGVNYGNRQVLGRRTEPIPGPTALMLLALQGYGREPRVAASAAYLLRQALASRDLEHLAWARLALDCHRDQGSVEAGLASLDEKIRVAALARDETCWLRPAIMRDALAALALGAENPFRLPEALAAGLSQGTLLAAGTQEAVPAGEPGAFAAAADSSNSSATAKPWGERVRSVFRGLAVEAAGRLRQPPPLSAVHIARAENYQTDLAAILQRQYQSFRLRVPLAGKRVVLKPNLVEYRREKVINTNPHVVAAAIELCRREGALEVIVAEGPGHWRNAEYLVQDSGLGDVLRHYQVPFVDLNHDEPVKTINLGRLTRLEYLYLARTIADAEVVISLPKLKTHHWAGATLSLKNLFGTLPGICYGWPKNELHWRGIENSIVDIALTRPPDLAIVDGIVGMEGDGPLNGTAKPFGALIMGCDPVAVDATCCRLMELDPEKTGYLILGYRRKLGLLREAEIAQLGERIEDLAQPFETVPHFRELRLARSA